jgi:mono/diheme cytochrome c family protein
MAVWNTLFIDDAAYKPNPDKTEQWNRGAYLTQGLGHCGACHTPRGLFLQEKAMDESDSSFLSGASLDHWFASSLNGDINSGLGRWTKQDIVEFLKTGHNRFGNAFGTMVEVVNTSTHHMTEQDLNAMAEYLKSLPAVNEVGEPAYSYNEATANALRALEYDEPGALIYSQNCLSCHQADGKGQSPYHPPLAGNPVLMDADPSSLINITLNGSLRVIANDIPDRYNMPYFRELLTDSEIAQVVSFMRTGWGNSGDVVTEEDVRAIRDATDPTRHDIRILRMK